MSDQIINKYNYTQDVLIRQAQRIDRTSGTTTGVAGNTLKQSLEGSFKTLLDERISEQLEKVTFSKHAAMRTSQRNISLTDTDVAKLGEACNKASKKGIKEALVVMNDSAFIVNAPNKVVVTVVDKNELKENIFTNIDGALFI